MKIFVDDFDNGISRPVDYPYLKFLRYNLTFLNAWPGKELGENVSKYRFLKSFVSGGIASFYFSSGIYYYLKNMHKMKFYDKGHIYITLVLSVFILLRTGLTNVASCKNIIAMFLTKMHLFHYKHVSDFAKQTHKRIHYISQMFSMYMVSLSFIGMLGFNFFPVYRNYALGKFKVKTLHNETYEHSIYIILPFDIYTNFNGYIGGVLLNCLASYICSAWFVLWDLLMCSIVFHLWGHYNILIHDLDSFPLPAQKRLVTVNESSETANAEMYSEEELEAISTKLKECIDYHRSIAEYTNKMSNAFGPMLLVFYAFHQVIGCLLLLECSQMTTEAMMVYGPLSGVSFQQLIQMSVIFELIGTASENLKDAVYGVPWEYMDINNRKTVAIFLINVQEPVHVKAMGIANVGVTTMAAILKTSFTYFTFLQSL